MLQEMISPFLGYLSAHNRYMHIVGIGAIVALCYVFSRNRHAINLRLVLTALVVHFGAAFCLLKTSVGSRTVQSVATGVAGLYSVAEKGIAFVFGELAQADGPWGFIFAVKVLPIIIFFGSFMSLLSYYGVIHYVVGGLSSWVRPLFRTSGPETLCVIANSFLGQTEAPLLVRNYIGTMTRSEIFLVMVSGMGTISGAILAVYSALGVPTYHLLNASILAIPATIFVAKMLLPEEGGVEYGDRVEVAHEGSSRNAIDAIAQGTQDGLQLALNVGAMLIAFVSLIQLCDVLLAYAGSGMNALMSVIGVSYMLPELSLRVVFGFLFVPVGYVFGLAGEAAWRVGELVGTKVIINEMVAYTRMLAMTGLSSRAIALVTYALCGFSNISCIGIQIGGIGALAPHKRHILSELGPRAVCAAMLANVLSACVVGLFL